MKGEERGVAEKREKWQNNFSRHVREVLPHARVRKEEKEGKWERGMKGERWYGERERAGEANEEARECKRREERWRERTTKLSSTLAPKRERRREGRSGKRRRLQRRGEDRERGRDGNIEGEGRKRWKRGGNAT